MKIYRPNRIKSFFLLLSIVVVVDKDCPAKSINQSILSKQEITKVQEGGDSSQSTDEAQPSLLGRSEEIKSMGLPKVWKPYTGLMFDWGRGGNKVCCQDR